jgi:hypothetical protein
MKYWEQRRCPRVELKVSTPPYPLTFRPCARSNVASRRLRYRLHHFAATCHQARSWIDSRLCSPTTCLMAWRAQPAPVRRASVRGSDGATGQSRCQSRLPAQAQVTCTLHKHNRPSPIGTVCACRLLVRLCNLVRIVVRQACASHDIDSTRVSPRFGVRFGYFPTTLTARVPLNCISRMPAANCRSVRFSIRP